MTSDERLKIAEEFIKARGWRGIHVGGLWVTFAPDGHNGWCVYHAAGAQTEPIAIHEDQLEALYLARQKLAAERDAKKSDREKRLERFALFVRDWLAGFGSSVVLKQRLEEALKETP